MRRTLHVLLVGMFWLVIGGGMAAGCLSWNVNCSTSNDCFEGQYCASEGVCRSGEPPGGDRDARSDTGTLPDGSASDGADLDGGDVADGGDGADGRDVADGGDVAEAGDVDGGTEMDGSCLERADAPDGACGCLFGGNPEGVCGRALRDSETGMCEEPSAYESMDESTCDGLDNDCDGTADEDLEAKTYYLDADGDGFGDPDEPKTDCQKPSGHVSNADDCYDGNVDAHPDQTNYFSADRGDGSFDYNCRNGEEQAWTRLDDSCDEASKSEACSRMGEEADGWRANSVPECGEQAYWLEGCEWNGSGPSTGTCASKDSSKTQKCR